MRIQLSSLCFAVALALFGVPAAQATIIDGAITGGWAKNHGGAFELLTPPPPSDLGSNNYNNLNLYAFDEDQNVTLLSDLNVDLGSSGTIDAGIVVASHYIFFDPKKFRGVKGYVTFDSEILGIIWSRGKLSASDTLMNDVVDYGDFSQRGFENTDWAKIASNVSGIYRVKFRLKAGDPGDYFRVLTATSPGATSVPAPGILMLFAFGMGLLGVGVVTSRRRRFGEPTI